MSRLLASLFACLPNFLATHSVQSVFDLNGVWCYPGVLIPFMGSDSLIVCFLSMSIPDAQRNNKKMKELKDLKELALFAFCHT